MSYHIMAVTGGIEKCTYNDALLQVHHNRSIGADLHKYKLRFSHDCRKQYQQDNTVRMRFPLVGLTQMLQAVDTVISRKKNTEVREEVDMVMYAHSPRILFIEKGKKRRLSYDHFLRLIDLGSEGSNIRSNVFV